MFDASFTLVPLTLDHPFHYDIDNVRRLLGGRVVKYTTQQPLKESLILQNCTFVGRAFQVADDGYS